MQGRLRTTVLACACALAVGGCGSGDDGTIPADHGENLIRALDDIESALASGDCEFVVDQANAFRDQVAALPTEVDDEVQSGLLRGADQLVALSEQPDQCEDTTGATGDPDAEPATTTGTGTDDATTTPTTTTTTTEPEEQEEPPPADEDAEQDEGGGDDGGEPPLEVPGGGGGGEGRTGGSDSGGLTGKGGRG